MQGKYILRKVTYYGKIKKMKTSHFALLGLISGYLTWIEYGRISSHLERYLLVGLFLGILLAIFFRLIASIAKE